MAFAGFGYGAAPDNDFSGGDSQSAKARQLMERHFPKEQGDRLTLATKADKGIDDPAAKRRIERVVADLADSPVTGPVVSPFQDKSLVTTDRRIARTTIPLAAKEVDKGDGRCRSVRALLGAPRSDGRCRSVRAPVRTSASHDLVVVLEADVVVGRDGPRARPLAHAVCKPLLERTVRSAGVALTPCRSR
ncbi:MMPL family transporter [Streptomyces sp. NPDC093105]|uniref:MMPL family transporter n=1 Tax=Streptomyces sp. NPDC093105 TaxID=3366029 RepID=UPI00380888A2